MSSPVRPILPKLEATASPRQPGAALPYELLEEILVRVASPADLARASTACISFRRLITDPVFLRRYRSLHPPLVLGLVSVNRNRARFDPNEAPHPGAPGGRAMARAADFSFDYVPRGTWGGWDLVLIYDGRVLLESRPCLRLEVELPDLAVCDPLCRRYLLLPPIPDGQSFEQNLRHYDVLFAPSVDEEDDETSFRVIMVMNCDQELVVTAFSSGSGSWSVSASTSWDTLSLSLSGLTVLSEMMDWPSYAYNCLHWEVRSANKLFKLNMNTKKFSTVDLPPEHDKRIIHIVEEGNGMLGMFSQHIWDKSSPAHYHTSVQKEGKIANEWQLKNTILLPVADCCLSFVCQPQWYIFLTDYKSECSILDFKTMTVERVNTTKCQDVQPYLGYPPFMSPRRI